jgi:dipeptidyl-peptidase-4
LGEGKVSKKTYPVNSKQFLNLFWEIQYFHIGLILTLLNNFYNFVLLLFFIKNKLYSMKKPVIILISFFVSIFVYAQNNQKITLDDLFIKGTFYTQSFDGMNSMNDGEHYTTLNNMGTRIIKHSYKTGEEVDVIFDITKIQNAPISAFQDYELSADETKILLITNTQAKHRHSYSAQYYVWNSVTKELTALSEKKAQQLATFSPDGDRVAFVSGNNIFIKNLRFGSESQITTDGEKDKIINGTSDWVYEEEFGLSKAFWWSPDSKFLAYLRFDESEVAEYSLTMFAGAVPELVDNKLYPDIKTIKYPKAGEKNPDVKAMVYDIASRTSIAVNIEVEKDFYIPRLNWAPNSNDLVVMRLNRLQNILDIFYANPYTGDTRPLITEKNNRYISSNFFDDFTFLDDGKFVVNSERNGWSHLYLYDKQGFELGQITKGNFDVTDFYGYDATKKVFYYQAAAESPLRREIYFISSDLKTTGKISTLTGTNSVVFSKNYKYYVNYYSNNTTPTLITLHENNKGKQIRVLQDNTVLKNTVKNFNVPKKEFFTFKTHEGIELNGYMMKPSNFDASKKYPVLMTQYSGPNSQEVTDSWKNVGWEEYIAQEGFIVACVDPRGTAARGEDFRKATYMQLGKYESDDQIEAAKYLGTLPFVDKNKIAIFGWSYGGFVVCMSMEKGGEIFKAGISVAPVTDWRFYDTIYAERFMRTPNENKEGYEENSLIENAGNIKGRLLIVHGLADDNVHAQNTFEFTERLVQAGIQFDMAIYTNRNHNINGGNTTMHLYKRMTDFLKIQL